MKQDTRELLLDSAFAIFYKDGFQGANIAAILKEVGINKGSMYHFFKSKKELGLAVIEERIAAKIKSKYETLLESATPFRSLFETLKSSPDTLIYGCPLNKMSQEMVYIDAEFSKQLSLVYSVFEKAIEAILVKAVELGEIGQLDTKMHARLIIATYEGALMIYHLNQNRDAYHQVLEMLENKFS